ncbi:hypothetical protein [Vibrio gallaecicus]|nr:hypothetical protein [Vibrio gallaecicus]MDN3616124.1 hypothetical protein [Vibrio gallaecicus]
MAPIDRSHFRIQSNSILDWLILAVSPLRILSPLICGWLCSLL